MARLTNRLSALGVQRETKAGYHCDGAGLYLQVSASGSKSWIFRYRMGDKVREMGLGGLNALTLAEARVKAKKQRESLANDADPIAVRNKDRAETKEKESNTFLISYKAQNTL